MLDLIVSSVATARLQQAQFALLVASTVALVALECVPALRHREFGPGRGRHALRNAALWVVGAVVVSLLLSGVVVPFALWLEARQVGLFYGLSLPPWARVLAGVVLIDAADYLYHRLSHEVGWLWRLHAVHHSDAALDVTTNVRAHPLHVALTVLWRLVVLAALGFPQWIAVLRDTVALPIALLHHANLRFPAGLDRGLRWLVVTPAIHRVHHSTVAAQTDSNYGGFFSVWDRLFGSYVAPARGVPVAYGLDTVTGRDAGTLFGMLRTPWRIGRATRAV